MWPYLNPVRIKNYGVEYRKLSSYWLASEALCKRMSDAYFTMVNEPQSEHIFENYANLVSVLQAKISKLDIKYQKTLPLFGGN